MRVHLVTMVGHSVTTLAPMLTHYRELGIESFHIYLHRAPGRDAALEEAQDLCRSVPGAVTHIIEGDWLDCQAKAFSEMSGCPNDWFVLADQDEFQLYPAKLESVLQECESHGFDHVRGALVDRVAAEGALPPLDPSLSVWEQYPIGTVLTYAVCGGDPRKIVAARGSVRLANGGHHTAISGRALPVSALLVQVHHFKWVAGVVEYLQARTSCSPPYASLVQQEAERFLLFFEANGHRIPLEEPGLLAQRCTPHYPKWSAVTALLNSVELYDKVTRMYSKLVSDGTRGPEPPPTHG